MFVSLHFFQAREDRVFKIQENLCGVLSQIARRLRCSDKRRHANIRRRSEAQHCSSLCSQSEGDEYCGDQARAENPTKSCPRALAMFATCSWPSLCEQSELQCWRRNRRLCWPAQSSPPSSPIKQNVPPRMVGHRLRFPSSIHYTSPLALNANRAYLLWIISYTVSNDICD